MNAPQTFTSTSVKNRQGRKSKTLGAHDHVKSLKTAEQYFFLVVLLDFLLLNGWIIGGLSFQIPLGEIMAQHPRELLYFLATANVLAILVGAFTEVYRVYEDVSLKLRIRELVMSSVIYFGFLGLIYYQLFFTQFEVHFLIPAFFMFVVTATMVHAAASYLSESRSRYLTFAVIGGETSGIRNLENLFAAAYGKRSICIGRFADDHISGVNNLGDYREIKSFLQQEKSIGKLFYFDSTLSSAEVHDIMQLCRNYFVDFEIVPQQVVSIFQKGMEVDHLSHLPVFRRKREPLSLLKNKIIKRLFDIVFSSLVILFVFPWLFPIIALLIRLESRGPIFFTQQRSGYWNRPFACFKFRSMRVNSESDRQQAVRSDDRITKVGAFLRKTSIDELPQFFNVLMGHMSVVGPRPHMLKHTEEYADLIDTFMIRHAVKPGITGLAQVSGWRGPTPEIYQMAKRVELDVEYIENWSFWLDLKCIFLTVCNAAKGEQNAF